MAAPGSKPTLKVYETDAIVADKVCEFIAERSRAAIKERGVFTIGLSGKLTNVIGFVRIFSKRKF